jgi:hypothetical protein
MNNVESSEKMNPDEMEWYRDHPILARDYAFDEDDERFSKVPLELMPSSDHPNQDSLTRGTELGSSRFLFETRFDRTLCLQELNLGLVLGPMEMEMMMMMMTTNGGGLWELLLARMRKPNSRIDQEPGIPCQTEGLVGLGRNSMSIKEKSVRAKVAGSTKKKGKKSTRQPKFLQGMV